MMNLLTRDYGRYTSTHALSQLHADRPQLFQTLVDLILDSLENDYCYALGYFPSNKDKESADQRDERSVMLQEWLEELD